MQDHTTHNRGPYRMLALELVADFIIMYFVMFAMIASLDHLRHNLNNLYMTLMMVAPMAVLMLVTMRSMYPDRRLNLFLIVLAAILFAVATFGVRTQAAIGDRQFLRSMIPHHSGAILMCREAKLSDPEIVRLCDGIARSQAAEIAQMEAILRRL
jgi:uncharacterized protein (DUF305 family)